MDDKCKPKRECGIIERGEIISADNGTYDVKSLDREGIKLQLTALREEDSYSAGDKVSYFCFRDGTGRIICLT